MAAESTAAAADAWAVAQAAARSGRRKRERHHEKGQIGDFGSNLPGSARNASAGLQPRRGGRYPRQTELNGSKS